MRAFRRACCLALCLSILALPGAQAPASGTWIWAGQPGADFQVVISEKGNNLSGEMTGTALKGNRVSTGVFSGTRTGDSAKLAWAFKDGDQAGPQAGTATLTGMNGTTMRWKLEYEGKDDCWFPRAAILKRKARPVRRVP